MSFFYTHEPGHDGQIVTEEGTPGGVELSKLLGSGPVPIRAAMELVAHIADILTIAEEDGAVHGDLKPGFVRVDAQGAVSVEGYGVSRRGGRAPDRIPSIASDTYGLGVILHAVLSAAPLGNIPREREAHDDAILEAMLSIDWQSLSGRAWLEAVQHFLCGTLAFDAGERPEPLDVANVFSEVSEQCGGPDLAEWARKAVAEGRRPDLRVIHNEDDENLGGPRPLGSPIAQGQALNMRQTARSKGASTAMWTRERIAALLSEGEEEDLPQANALSAGQPQYVPPKARKTAPPPANRTPPTDTAPPAPPAPSSFQRNTLPPPPVPRPERAARPPAPTHDNPDFVEPRVAPPADVGQRPTRIQPQTPPRAPAAQPQPTARPGKPQSIARPGRATDTTQPSTVPMAAVVAGFVLMALMCAGAIGVGVAAYYSFFAPDPAIPARAPVATPTEEPSPAATMGDVEDPEPTEAVGDDQPSRPQPRSTPTKTTTNNNPTKSRGSNSAKSSGATASGTAKTSGARETSSGSSASGTPEASAPAAPPTTNESTVKFVVRGAEAKLECGDSQSRTFVGTTRLKFDGITTCRVTIDGAVGVIQVQGDSTFTCVPTAGKVVCTPT